MDQIIMTLADYPITDEKANMDAFNMRKIARDGLADRVSDRDQLRSADGYDNIDNQTVAAALRQRLQGGKNLLPWSSISNASRKKWLDLAEFTISQFRISSANRRAEKLE